MLGKNFDGFGPIGPCIVIADELADPNRVALKTRLNGRLLHNGNTSDWLFPPPRLLSFISELSLRSPATSSRPARRRASACFRSRKSS